MVATAFIVQSYQLHQSDYNAPAVAAMLALAASLAGSGTVDLSARSAFDILALVAPSPRSRWVDGIWITSLVLSASVAFLSTLTKQWIREYRDRTTAPCESPRYWAHRRALYFEGLDDWGLTTLISLLPLVLHAALFLFLSGLIVLLWGLQVDRVVAVGIIAISASLLLFYAITILLPMLFVACPTSTPLSRNVRRALSVTRQVAVSSWIRGIRYADIFQLVTTPAHVQRWTAETLCTAESVFTRASLQMRHALARLVEAPSDSAEEQSSEAVELDRRRHELAAGILKWMVMSCTDQDIITVGVQASGALRTWSVTARLLDQARPSFWAKSYSHVERKFSRTPTEDPGRAADYARDWRATFMRSAFQSSHRHDWLSSSTYYCFPLLYLLHWGKYNFAAGNVPVGTWNAAVRVALKLDCPDNDGSPTPAPFRTSVALLILNGRVQPFTIQTALYIVASLNSSDLVHEDLDIIGKAFARKLPSQRHLDHVQCGSACVVDLLSEATLSRSSVALDETDVSVAAGLTDRFVTQTLQDFPETGVNNGKLSLSRGDLSQFMQFIPDHTFPETKRNEYALSRACSLLVLAARDDPSDRWPAGLNRSLRRLFFLISHLDSKELPDRLDMFAWDLLQIVADDFTLLRFLHTTGRPIPRHPLVLDTSIDSDLGPLSWLYCWEDCRISLWSSVWTHARSPRWESDVCVRDAVAAVDVFATYMCAHSRQGHPAAPELVKVFFSADWIRFCLDGYSQPRRNQAQYRVQVYQVERILQHCAELNPDWWPALFSKIMSTNGNAHQEAAKYLDAKLRALGPCKECPGRVVHAHEKCL